MTISVIQANSSMSVIPGSETLCSVHSGQLWAIPRPASLTRARRARPPSGTDGRRVLTSLLGRDDVEGVDEVAHVVGGAQLVLDVDHDHLVEDAAPRGALHGHLDGEHLDARLPAVERDPDLLLDAPDQVGV